MLSNASSAVGQKRLASGHCAKSSTSWGCFVGETPAGFACLSSAPSQLTGCCPPETEDDSTGRNRIAKRTGLTDTRPTNYHVTDSK